VGNAPAKLSWDGKAVPARCPPYPIGFMHSPPNLPPDLRQNLDRLAHGMSRKALAGRAATQSRNYRAGGGSRMIATPDDALAYAFARMPATYAAAIAAFDALREALPEFEPRSLLDVGAGPGTAAFAAGQLFGRIASFRLIDANASLRGLALTLLAAADCAPLREASYREGDALALLANAAPADLVTAGYMAGEIPDRDLPRFTHALWAATAGALVVVEPGTPAGHARILRMRAELITAGAMWRRPARTPAPARCMRPTGAISPNDCRARVTTCASSAPKCRSRTRDSPMSWSRAALPSRLRRACSHRPGFPKALPPRSSARKPAS
jgi:SAM-dependent methyltransferase